MSFRNPLRTATAVNPGTAGPRVVVTQNGDRMGGGAVQLYPNAAGVFADLTAGSDTDGLLATLTSPPRADGQRSSITLSSTDRGDDSIRLFTPPGGRVRMNNEPYQRQRAWNFRRADMTGAPASSSTLGAGWNVCLDGTIVAAPAGDYLIVAALNLSASAATTAASQQLLVNGVDQLQTPGNYGRVDLTTSSDPKIAVLPLTNYAGGDLHVQSQVYGPTGVTVYLVTTLSNLSIVYLGPNH